MEEHYEVCLIYNLDDTFEEENVRVTKRGKHYEVAGIPLFSANLAVGDLISVEEDDGKFYFLDLIETSEHSTVQIVFFRPECRQLLREKIVELGGRDDNSSISNYLAVDIPKAVDYSRVRSQLDHFKENGLIDFKEACLSDKHRAEIIQY